MVAGMPITKVSASLSERFSLRPSLLDRAKVNQDNSSCPAVVNQVVKRISMDNPGAVNKDGEPLGGW